MLALCFFNLKKNSIFVPLIFLQWRVSILLLEKRIFRLFRDVKLDTSLKLCSESEEDDFLWMRCFAFW